MTKNNEQIIIDGVDVSGWTDEEVCYKFEHHSAKTIKQIAFDLYKQLKRKEQECEELKEQLTILDDEDVVVEITVKQFEEYNKLKQTLEEIREVLELYANSKVDEQQEDGSYKILLNGGFIVFYDPKPAREALRKINEVKNEN